MKWLNPHFLSLGLAILSVWLIFYYQGKYQQKAKDYDDLNTKYQTQVIAINQQQERIQHLAELDKTHTQELAHAKTEIDILRADVAAGRRKLRIKAICPVSETVASSGMVDATPVELTGETGSTVLDIREGIINDRAKLRYLQEYVSSEVRHGYGN